MAYRGGDLDLRTPRPTAPAAGEPGYPAPETAQRARGATATGPIYVDEIVLSCVNHAFDVAFAHRSGEVRLEHLLHALTRVEPAAEELEQRGVRVPALRRDTAAAIASDIPAGFQNGKVHPPRSNELEHVLRVASMMAQRRDQPAGLNDLIHVLLDVEPDLPGLALLGRSLNRIPLASEPPPYARPAYQPPEPRFTDLPERPRPPAPTPVYYQEPPRTEYAPMPAPTPVYYPEPARTRTEYIPVPAVDSQQNARMEALEQMVRALSADLAAERKSFGGILQAVQRDVGEQRTEVLRSGHGIAERVQGALADRLDGIERMVAGLRNPAQVDMGPIHDRIGQIDRALSASIERLMDAIREMEARQKAQKPADLSEIAKRLDLIEEAVMSSDGERAVADLAQRIAALGTEVGGELQKRVGGIEALLAQDRTRNAEAGAALRGEIGALAEGLARQRSEIASAVLKPVADGLQQMATETQNRQAAALEGLRVMADRLQAAERAISGVAAKTEQIVGDNSLRTEKIVAEFSAKTEGQAGQLSAKLDELAQRSGQVYAAYETRVQEAQDAAHDDLKELHEALMKLNANQHTLAQAIEQWRSESRQTMVTLASEVRNVAPQMSSYAQRFAGIEGETARVAGLIEGMSGTVDRMHRVTVERYYRRNRFWYWLFGTDDWVAASWPSQAERITDELRSVKGPQPRR